MSGGVRVYEPPTDLYVAYEYQATERGETLQYGSNSPTALSVRLPVRWRGATQARAGRQGLAADRLPAHGRSAARHGHRAQRPAQG